MSWQVQEAKQRFSEVLRAALDNGPQTITRHGKEIAVVIDIDEYRRLAGPPPDLKQLLLEGPPFSDEFTEIVDEIVAERRRGSHDADRELDLEDIE